MEFILSHIKWSNFTRIAARAWLVTGLVCGLASAYLFDIPNAVAIDPLGIRIPKRVLKTAQLQAVSIMENTPPSSHFIVNLGLSNTIQSAFLRKYIPIKADREMYYRDVPIIDLHGIKSLTELERNALFNLMIPSKEILGDRTIVLSRVLWEGNTMKDFLPYLVEYLEKEGYTNKIQADFIVKGTNQQSAMAHTLDDLIPENRRGIHKLEANKMYADWTILKANRGEIGAPLLILYEMNEKKPISLYDFIRRESDGHLLTSWPDSDGTEVLDNMIETHLSKFPVYPRSHPKYPGPIKRVLRCILNTFQPL